MSADRRTVETYNTSAEALAEYFKGIGARVDHIEKALNLASVNDGSATVVEIGCGDGRDAEEIIKRVASYVGFDPSEGMLRLARKRLPAANFVCADSDTFPYPLGVDVIYAFASLIHSNPDTNRRVFSRLASSLRVGGIALVNVRMREKYQVEVQQDQFGVREYHYYTSGMINDISGDSFVVVDEDVAQIGSNTWLTMALQRTGSFYINKTVLA